MGAPSSSYNLATSGVKFTGPCVYRGGVAFSTGAAVVKVWDSSTGANGRLLDVYDVTANVAVSRDIAGGVRAANGLYVEVVSGTPEGSVRLS